MYVYVKCEHKLPCWCCETDATAVEDGISFNIKLPFISQHFSFPLFTEII